MGQSRSASVAACYTIAAISTAGPILSAATNSQLNRLTRPNARRKVQISIGESKSGCAEMPHADLPYTYVSRKKLAGGRWRDYWRFRRDGVDAPLPGAPGLPKFHRRYAELISASEQAKAAEQARTEAAETQRHTFSWLCEAYLDSAEFKQLSDRTQADYRYTIDERLKPVLGPERYDSIQRRTVKLLRDQLADQPRTAHKIRQMVSRLYSWADENDLVEHGFNPAAGIRKLKAKVKHITIWSDEEIELFLKHCEPFMATPVLLALYTGQRREDLVTMTWSDYHDGVIRVRQNKTGEPLDLPCHPRLREHLDAKRTGFGGVIVRAANGRPLNANSLSAALNRAVAAISEMPHRSWHGLRYAAAGKLEEAGCSVVEITSVIGHRTFEMAMQYISQRKAAQAAVGRLDAAG